jgi:hypothetical protein
MFKATTDKIDVRFTDETETWLIEDYANEDDAETCAFGAVHATGDCIKAEVLVNGVVTTTYPPSVEPF